MTLTNTDLNAIGSLIDQKLDQKLKQNNQVLEKRITQQMADTLAENNKIIIDSLEKFIEEKSETKTIKQQLTKHSHRLDKIESQLIY